MKTLLLLLTTFAGASGAAQAQGTFVYDQESSTDETYPYGGVPIQFYGSVGQSFTPSLSGVGFFRVKLYDGVPGNALGATLVGTLRSTAINGPILGTTMPVVLSNGFAGSVDFFFASAVPVTPFTTYYFQTSVQSGDDWGITVIGDTYPGGAIYGGLQPFTGNDLWFREGIYVVPEPSSALLFCLGSGVVSCFLRQKMRRLPSPVDVVATNDTTLLFAEGIHAEDFDIIRPGQDLYVCDLTGGLLLKVSRDYFTNYVGQLLITSGGDFGSSHQPAKFFAARWDAAATNFVVRHLLTYSNDVEHVTFAPINLPALNP